MSSSKSKRDKALYENLKNWSMQVKERDRFKCAICGGTEELQAHHILEKKMFPKYMLDLDNGITLCSRHHAFSKESAHHSAIFFNLWLFKNRPEQFKKVLKLLSESLPNKEFDFLNL